MNMDTNNVREQLTLKLLDLFPDVEVSKTEHVEPLLQLIKGVVEEVIGGEEDVTLKDLSPVGYDMKANRIHRLGRNELRAEQRQRLLQLLGEDSVYQNNHIL